MLYVDDQPVVPRFALDKVLGRALVQRDDRDTTSPILFARMAWATGAAMAVTSVFSWRYLPLLSALAVALAALFAFVGVTLGRDAQRRRATQALGLEVTYGLHDVRVRSRDGERVLALADGLDHPLADWAPPGTSVLLQVRAALADEPADAPVRLAMEWAVWAEHDDEAGPRRYVALPPDRGPYGFAADADADALLQRLFDHGVPVFELAMHRRDGSWWPVPERDAIRAVRPPVTPA